ncbi:MFS multidrug transporter [Phlyctema vagabunda]|uniref:MFS multidrug transporter n=1 Tax=Phlyctema vagabunda TaxID=108571 RepID=A0ABR4PRU3_9HELO
MEIPSDGDDLIPEDVPLFVDEPRDTDGPSQGAHNAPAVFTLFLFFMGLHFLIAFCEMILVAPSIKIYENSLCVAYYLVHDPSVIGPGDIIEESLCKITEVQVSLATIRGWKSLYDTIPVLLLAIPYGKLGDRYGHRKIMSLSLVGLAGSLCEIFVVCAFPRVFPLELIWLSSIILLFGGGFYPFAANMWAMASEAIPPERRSVTFYYMFSAFYVAELVASFIASVTIDISPWIPCGLAFASLFVCLFLLWAMPDPRHSGHYLRNKDDTEVARTESTKQVLADGIKAALTNRNILLTLPVFLVGTLRYTTLNVLIQYASVRFGMKLSKGATFYTEAAVVTIFLFMFLVPRSSDYIRTRYGVRSQKIDLVLARTSVTLLCTGALLLGLAPTAELIPIGLFFFSAGFGSKVSALSLVSYWISDSSKATLFAGIAVLENIGHAIGDPSMHQLLAAAFRLPPVWLALPFFVAASIYSLAIISTLFIKLDRDVESDRRVD